jgi:hypothetical protein
MMRTTSLAALGAVLALSAASENTVVFRDEYSSLKSTTGHGQSAKKGTKPRHKRPFKGSKAARRRHK